MKSGFIHAIYFCCQVVAWITLSLAAVRAYAQSDEVDRYNIVWNSQSKNSSESMPCGGGDVGLNVWVENGDLLFYFSRSGAFDENNAFLKYGRIRVSLNPNPLSGENFKQELVLRDGMIKITDSKGSLTANLSIWVDVYRPVIHLAINTGKRTEATISFESWRFKDRQLHGKENNANSYKWAKREVITRVDEITFDHNDILFYHRNKEETVFDVTVSQQGLDSVKSLLFNPLSNLIFGGLLRGSDMHPAGTDSGKYINTDYKSWKIISNKPSLEHHVSIYLHHQQSKTIAGWKDQLNQLVKKELQARKNDFAETKKWWHQYWQRSFVFIESNKRDPSSSPWQVSRNYQLFRYMLGCNAYGQYPTKFNGGLFTFDPVLVDTALTFTPDHRNWGGGTMTAQNQRLVYFPMLKSGDVDMMTPQFNFYLRTLKTAELRSKMYWNHGGASYTEQLENFGLPNCSEYGWNRPPWFDKGVEYNAWLEYEWDTVLEFCLMMLETERYFQSDITIYIPFIESCLTFFDEHYQYLARIRGIKSLDHQGHLILYPGSAAETYKMAYNATSTIAALKTVITRMLELSDAYLNTEQRNKLSGMLQRIPPISFREFDGHKTIAPALHWERINNTETPQLYPVFPWGLYGIRKPDLDIAINTFKYDTSAVNFRSYIGWKQDNIFAARLGLTTEAADLTIEKLKDSGRRFPAFWGPGYDWVPDHNWGGSGMIGLQEMLLQADGATIFLLPAWPKEWNVHFKLHAPYQTTVECIYRDGKIESLQVFPESRKKDIIVLNHSHN